MNAPTRRIALRAIAAIAILASANALAHSYAGQFEWAVHHRLTGWQAKSRFSSGWRDQIPLMQTPRRRGSGRRPTAQSAIGRCPLLMERLLLQPGPHLVWALTVPAFWP
jgi:hypothetical protein